MTVIEQQLPPEINKSSNEQVVQCQAFDFSAATKSSKVPATSCMSMSELSI